MWNTAFRSLPFQQILSFRKLLFPSFPFFTPSTPITTSSCSQYVLSFSRFKRSHEYFGPFSLLLYFLPRQDNISTGSHYVAIQGVTDSMERKEVWWTEGRMWYRHPLSPCLPQLEGRTHHETCNDPSTAFMRMNRKFYSMPLLVFNVSHYLLMSSV